jgi:hypothetical protein
MTEFSETGMRHYCRNPKCRSNLKAPVRLSARPYALGAATRASTERTVGFAKDRFNNRSAAGPA